MRKPGFTERYRLGVELSKHLDPVCTLEELGRELGISTQNAYTQSVLALGTLAWHLKHRLSGGGRQGCAPAGRQ